MLKWWLEGIMLLKLTLKGSTSSQTEEMAHSALPVHELSPLLWESAEFKAVQAWSIHQARRVKSAHAAEPPLGCSWSKISHRVKRPAHQALCLSTQPPLISPLLSTSASSPNSTIITTITSMMRQVEAQAVPRSPTTPRSRKMEAQNLMGKLLCTAMPPSLTWNEALHNDPYGLSLFNFTLHGVLGFWGDRKSVV
jgi:hypothetical protein